MTDIEKNNRAPNAADSSAPSPAPAKPRAKKAARRSQQGDTAPSLTPADIETFEVEQAIGAAEESKIVAVTEILQTESRQDPKRALKALESILAGASPDDVHMLRRALMRADSKRFMEHLNPRGAHVVALEKPSETERGQWYFQRYIQHLPSTGEIVLFDRSWYNRAGVERVMGFCSNDEYNEFMRQVPEFERNLVRSGIHLIKFWFSVSRDEQRRRFRERESHPLKQWKLSPIDLASLDKWDDYTKAKEAMFFYTDTADSPWTVVKSDCRSVHA